MDTTVCSFNDDYHGSVIIEVLYIYICINDYFHICMYYMKECDSDIRSIDL